jgi:hypothetical protein
MPLEPDRDQIELFVDSIFRHAAPQGFVAVRSFFEGDDSKPARLSNAGLVGGLRFLIDVAEDDARRAAQHPRPIVFCPPLAVFAGKDRARESDIAEGLALSVECDVQPLRARTALETVLGLATVVVKSGGRWANGGDEAQDKLHLHWRLTKPARGDELKKLKQARDLAARIVGGDPSNKPICHPIRWPGSWHRKAEPRLCQIAALDPDREIELDAALSALTAAAPDAAKASPDDFGDHAKQDDWPQLVDDIVSGRSFHAPLVSLAARLVGSNTHDGTAVKLLRALMTASADERDGPRWQSGYDSIPRIVATAREKFAEPQPGAQASLIWYGDAPPAPPAYLVDETLPETGLAIVGGQYGAAKTFVVADLAAAIIVGDGDFTGKLVRRKGGILWLAAEGAMEIDIRIHAAVTVRGFDASARQPFARQGGAVPCLAEKEALERLKALATQAADHLRKNFNCELVLIVIDTLSAAAGFDDENSAAETQKVMTVLAALAGETKTLVLVLDHYGKMADVGVRGSSAKSAAADAILACLGDRDPNTGALNNRRLSVAKLRGGPTGRVIPFDLERTEDGSTCVVEWQTDTEPAPAAPKGKPWPKALVIFKRALDEATGAAGKMRTPRAGMPEVMAVDREAVRAEFYRLYVADTLKAKRDAFARCAKDAVERGVMCSINVGPDLGQTIFWTP